MPSTTMELAAPTGDAPPSPTTTIAAASAERPATPTPDDDRTRRLGGEDRAGDRSRARGARRAADDSRPGITADVELDHHRRPDGPDAADHVNDHDPSDHDPDGDCADDTRSDRADESGRSPRPGRRSSRRHRSSSRHQSLLRSSHPAVNGMAIGIVDIEPREVNASGTDIGDRLRSPGRVSGTRL